MINSNFMHAELGIMCKTKINAMRVHAYTQKRLSKEKRKSNGSVFKVETANCLRKSERIRNE
jgi:hypothetical protein